MAGLLSGLESLGLKNLENVGIFDKEKKEEKAKEEAKVHEAPVFSEEDFIYDKTFKCPVCDASFSSKIMKTGKAKLKRTDFDLRPVYEGVAAEKYDVLLCPRCGYAALGRYFSFMLPAQAKLIKENISSNVVLTRYDDPTYSFEQALERYKLALACSVVKRGKSSEKAYVCLRMAWLMRSYREYLADQDGDNKELMDSLLAQEEEYEENAYNGFLDARGSEDIPIAGMDATTLDYLLAQLAFHFKDYQTCSRMVSGILTSPSANPRIKDKVRTLKDQLAEAREA
ncbi:MAG: DUF2225 domain-containing protein [Lachnospiraceae bacterium]|nr:DUF2225 domain-containing protein [Lachnospiraceae bacterium]